jgi:hypothetical protein
VKIVDVDRDYVERQLNELMNWADYLHLTLTMDQPHEPGKLRLLEALAPELELDQLRFELRTVRYRLENLAANLNRVPPGPVPAPLPRIGEAG